MMMGSVYMLAVPMSITTTFFFSPYERQYVFSLLTHTLMFSTNMLLLFQVSYKGSSYMSANLDALGVLPMSFSKAKTNSD
jgi:hypothetical protein